MIKKLHSHDDGKVCYTSSNPHEQEIGLYMMNGKEFIVAFNSYCWKHFAYDPDTGHEIASFNKEFFELNIKRFIIATMERDPNCH